MKGEFERLCALYGYRRIDTPVFEDTELFARTSGEGSDIVTKEMYTFTDRGDRSLTLRPEATAPIVRAYLEHGLHREPQPQKLYTIETIYRYGRPQKGRFREYWQLDVEAIGSDDPACDAEVIQLYDALLGRLGIDRVPPRAELDRRRRVPARVPRGAPAALARRARRRARRGDARAGGAQPAARARQHRREAAGRAGGAAAGAGDRRLALRRVPRALRRGAPLPRRVRRPRTSSCRRSCAGSTTTRARPGSSSARRAARSRRSPAAAATTASPRQLGGPHTPGVGFGAGIERLLLALEHAGTPVPEDEGIDVFFVCAEGADRAAVLAKVTELRAAGVRADADFAGRSVKGQHTQAGRLGAKEVVVVEADTDLAEATA